MKNFFFGHASHGEQSIFLRTFTAALLLFVASFPMAVSAAVPDKDVSEKAVFGHIEKASINGDDRYFSARLDTGAQRSSMHARDIEKFERDGKEWVRFVFDDHDGGAHEIERPLIEQTDVRQAGGVTTRYVVSLPLCIGERQQDTEFTLADRSAMTYPMLVGRNFLSRHVLVSSAHRYTADPTC
ncbi:ATP-dependent zinc protease [Alcanivorax sp. JB21]|uniref:ATP-dependent zinc protease family protein n=1 Tax=Alcanivorax limicola TaxID=2874102 RepID=UPI001CBE0477|nr:ATP-dependent zinc protease [Alcanivorax limicola]MBZ2189216.1 ATP-dependent zinc protease [Alcanivorax limicola]